MEKMSSLPSSSRRGARYRDGASCAAATLKVRKRGRRSRRGSASWTVRTRAIRAWTGVTRASETRTVGTRTERTERAGRTSLGRILSQSPRRESRAHQHHRCEYPRRSHRPPTSFSKFASNSGPIDGLKDGLDAKPALWPADILTCWRSWLPSTQARGCVRPANTGDRRVVTQKRRRARSQSPSRLSGSPQPAASAYQRRCRRSGAIIRRRESGLLATVRPRQSPSLT